MSLARSPRGSVWWPAVLLAALLYWTLDLAVLRAGVPHPLDDGWEEAIVTQHLVAGDGFRTHMIYPPLWERRDPGTLTLPLMVHGPVDPLLLAIPFMTLGPRAIEAASPWSALIALLTLIPLGRLAARYFGAGVAAAAALLFTLSPVTLDAVHHSLSVVLGALLVTWALERVTDDPPHTLAAGALAGLAYLVRPEMMLAAVAMAIVTLDAARWRGASRFAAGFALIVAPWWLHQARATGSPWFNLSAFTFVGLWGDRPGFSILNDFALTPERFGAVAAAALPGLWRKWVAFFPHAAWHALRATSAGTGWLAPVGLIATLLATRAAAAQETLPAWLGPGHDGTASARPIRRFVLLATFVALIPVATSILADYVVIYFVVVLPLLAIGVAVGASVVAAWLRVPRPWPVLLAILLLPSVVMALRTATRDARALEVRLAGERAALAGMAGPGAPRLVFSDTPDFVAWTTGRPTVWTSLDGFQRLYASGDSAAARLGLPPRRDVGTWFHERPEDPRSLGFAVSRWSR